MNEQNFTSNDKEKHLLLEVSSLISCPSHENWKKDGNIKQALIDSIAKSLKDGEEITPIILNMKSDLIDGHHRLEAFLKAGKEKINCVILSEPESEEEKGYKLLKINQNRRQKNDKEVINIIANLKDSFIQKNPEKNKPSHFPKHYFNNFFDKGDNISDERYKAWAKSYKDDVTRMLKVKANLCSELFEYYNEIGLKKAAMIVGDSQTEALQEEILTAFKLDGEKDIVKAVKLVFQKWGIGGKSKKSEIPEEMSARSGKRNGNGKPNKKRAKTGMEDPLSLTPVNIDSSNIKEYLDKILEYFSKYFEIKDNSKDQKDNYKLFKQKISDMDTILRKFYKAKPNLHHNSTPLFEPAEIQTP